ncbi:hypothetical protein HWB07_gp101 [Bacillus phage vB_BsuM-Goe3]|uniref:Uncharacterized protein n=1 Tax=Bacillus phage vB_BsuM-Goe3 TaxID=1933063 RepID=A0A217ERD6_BPGO3|nr:hypothetical protein HWB07_gp101 [Bacillus phage vB_BsuM-Goe3]APZ82669.1 hypothetical protein Goe3_c20800 [Bacillus phage vB_BsuM-Goe3]
MREIKPMEITLETEEDVQRFCDLFDDTKLSPGILRARDMLKNHRSVPFIEKNKKKTPKT